MIVVVKDETPPSEIERAITEFDSWDVTLEKWGIRNFDRQHTRNVLDVSVIPVLRSLTHLPITIDPYKY